MKSRHGRLFSVADLDQTEHRLLTAAGRSGAEPVLPKPEELSWWDWTVFLLHAAAEIEHALLVQYLYAAYSLADGDFRGTSVPTNAAAKTRQWKMKLIGIAREEMAHLLTVQNLLRFIGGPLNLEREDFPFRTLLYPFPLALEPLTRQSLAKYVAAEMPADATSDPPELIREITRRAGQGVLHETVNRVGVVYDALAQILGDGSKLADTDFRPDTADSVQSKENHWHPRPRLIVRAVRTREEAVGAVRAVGAQGEGADVPSLESEPSHFDTFLQLYKDFPEVDEPEGSAAWVPSRPIAVNPNTQADPSEDANEERARITHPTTRMWAQLSNVRYRMLLVDLAHAMGLWTDGGDELRADVREWAFSEMYEVGGLAEALMKLPLKGHPVPGAAAMAGPPFELPYTLALPDDERGRWRLHLALLDASRDLIAKFRSAGDPTAPSALLAALEERDGEARVVVEGQLAP